MATQIMQSLLRVFSAPHAVSHEESFMAIGAVANATGEKFLIYMEHLKPCLIMGLRTFEEFNVCAVAVGICGDISRALGPQIKDFCDEIITCLLQLLQHPELNRSVKPAVISCFGDIALAIGDEFQKYLQVVLTMLGQAAQTQVPDDDEDLIEYLNSLRDGILEAYTGIIQGLAEHKKEDMVQPYVPGMVALIKAIHDDQNRYDNVTKSACGVVGDLAHSLGAKVAPMLKQQFVANLLHECCESDDAGK